MLVLISFVLVLVATGLLVVGLLQDGLALIYISIACSVAAGVILGVAVKAARPKAATPAGPAPIEGDGQAAQTSPAAVPAAVAPTQILDPTATDPVTAVVPVVAAQVRGEAQDVDPEPSAEGYEDDDEDFFPIADYDELRVNEIVPLLPELYADELDVVEERERAGKARKVVLGRIEQLRATAPTGEGADDGVEAELAPAVIEAEWAAVDDGWDAAADGEVAGFFPIADYDELRVNEILPLLPQLTEDELVEVREHEGAGANRKTILDNIDRRVGRGGRATVPVRSAAAKRGPSTNGAAATKRAATKKAATKKPTPAKKAVSAKAAAGGARSAAKRSAAKKASAKRASGARLRP